jgi:exopolyphosphatase / guanosine-5'-triphosphate,3'-diphosphate pyrophosphatase
MPRHLGIVDLGSNNARMVVYELEPGQWFQLVDDISEPVRLGEGLGARGRMTPGALRRGLAVLTLFADYAAAARLDELVILGTSALRDAGNAELLHRAIEPRDLRIQVLSGEEEARLGVLAVANGFAFEEAWVMDLGGGSAQISRMSQREFVEGRAYPLGAVRLTEAFLANDPPKRGEIRALESAVAAHLEPVAREIRRSAAPLVAMGGTLRNLARAVQETTAYPLSLLHGYALDQSDLDTLTEKLLRMSRRERAGFGGLNPERADVILAGALVYGWLLRATGRSELLVSGHGMREGMLHRHFQAAPHRIEDVRGFSVTNLMARFELDSAHTRHVRQLARSLFEALAPLHGLGPVEAELLDAASCLHDVGVTVDFYRHHRHGGTILEANGLPGFSHREHAVLIELLRSHHKGVPRLERFKALFDPGDKLRLAQLATCLRLAESFERSNAQRVEGVRVELGPKLVTLHLQARQEPVVEIWEATKHASLFRRAFGRGLEIETG